MLAASPARWIASAALAAVLIVLLHGAWELASAAPWIRLWIVSLVVLTVTRPDDGLLCLAGLLPIATAAGAITRAPVSLLEVTAVACFLGWTFRYGAAGTKGALRGVGGPLACCALVIVASAAVDVLGRREMLGHDEFKQYFGSVVPQTYFSDHDPREILHYSGALLTGLSLFGMAAVTSVRRPERVRPVLRMAAAGACGAAALSLIRIITVAIASEHPASRLVELLRTIRISVQFGDVNAAGSYFALMFFVAAGLSIGRPRWARAGWLATAAIIATAACLTSSRAAVIAIFLVSAGISVGRRRMNATLSASRGHWLPLAACALAAGIFVVAFPNKILGLGTWVALHVRVVMARISLSMLAAHPWFGIGIGRYYEASAPLLASSSLAVYYFRENAHNNYLQFVAELGLAGAAALGWLFWTLAVRVRSALRQRNDPAFAWLAAGLVAFLLTAVVGHPLLTPEVSLSFWLLLGITAGGSPARPSERHTWQIASGFCVLLLATFPARVQDEIRHLDREHVMFGFGPRSQESDGTAYQPLARRATFFLRGDSRFVRFALRATSRDSSGRSTTVAIELDGREVNRLTVGDEWTTVTLVTPTPPPDSNFHKVVIIAAPDLNDLMEIRIGPLQINYPPAQ